ncbi:MAG: type VI secretion system tip protein VgrG [Pseudomonadota bacterium]
MADSPLDDSDGPVEISIKSNGAAIDDTIEVVSVNTRAEINRIPEAILVIKDGDAAEQTFPVTDSATFKPGAEIEIGAGYGSQTPTTLFKGIVTAQRLRVGGAGKMELTVTCRDEGFKLSLGRRSRVFDETKDSDAISTLATEAGLSASVTATSVTHSKLVQYRCTDWDWIVARAETNGMVVSLSEGTLTLGKPDASTSAVLTVTFGIDLIQFDCEADARVQYSTVEATAWSVSDQAAVSSSGAQTTSGSWGDLTASDLAGVGGRDSFDVSTAAPLTTSELDAITASRQTRNALARLRGDVRFQGSGKAILGKTLEVAGLGTRFSGTGLISSVTHRIEAGRWDTTTMLGLRPDWRTDRTDSGGLSAPGAGGFTAPARGLQIGTVTKLTEDPNSELCVQVKVPLLGDASTTLWARLGVFYATQNAGAFFLPEVGDEVILGFFGDDPSFPVILGSLYSSARAGPYSPTDENTTKAIVTPQALKVIFDDEKKSLTLLTPGGNSVLLDDDGQSLTLEDQSGNSIVLDSNGISLSSAKDLILKASSAVTVQATADLSMSGMNVTAEADVGLTAKGSATAELSASGQVTVKGAMVMIN